MPRTCTVCWRPHGTMETSCNDGNPMLALGSASRVVGYRIQVSPQAAVFVGDLRPHSKLESPWT